ncbi:MAG: hypothetical protein J5506_11215 [Prevotella sp.]|nr:hypothetical protein [Prevotella sp.]
MVKHLALTSEASAWQANERNTSIDVLNTSLVFTKKAFETMKKTINPIRKYYSSVLERPLDTRQTLLLIHSQVAFALAAFPVECPLLLRAAFALWFGWSVRVCKQNL